MEEYSQVDLRIGTETDFNNHKAEMPEGSIFGITDAIKETELNQSLQDKINYKPTTVLDTSSTTPTITLTSNIEYIYERALTSLTISGFTKATLDEQPYWSITFYTGSTTPTISIPNSVNWMNGTPVFGTNKLYNLMFKKGTGTSYIGVWGEA